MLQVIHKKYYILLDYAIDNLYDMQVFHYLDQLSYWDIPNNSTSS